MELVTGLALLLTPLGVLMGLPQGVVGDALPLETIFKGIFWFLAMDGLTLTVLIAFPQISLSLPNLILY